VFNIGFGEMLLIAVLGLLVFGPDRLPGAVRQGAGMLRQLRDMAATARQQVADAAGMDQAETSRVMNEIAELHPKRLASSVLNPEPDKAAAARASTGIDPDLP